MSETRFNLTGALAIMPALAPDHHWWRGEMQQASLAWNMHWPFREDKNVDIFSSILVMFGIWQSVPLLVQFGFTEKLSGVCTSIVLKSMYLWVNAKISLLNIAYLCCRISCGHFAPARWEQRIMGMIHDVDSEVPKAPKTVLATISEDRVIKV